MRALADLLYPELCVGCGRRTPGGLCGGCRAALTRIGPAVCHRCGAPAPAPPPGGTRPGSNRPGGCRECRRVAFDGARQAVAFGPVVRSAVHRLKYRSERALAEALGLLVVELVEGPAGHELGVRPDGRGRLAATWVPTTQRRLRERGHDHGRLLADCVGDALGWPVLPLLSRVRDTPPQAGLEPCRRRSNVVGALAPAVPTPRHVVVVDDVYTTGATASEAARALRAGGAERVVVLGVARALRPV